MTEEKIKIVALGGGTGMKALLAGLHRRAVDICAIITVADDGGSSGRLRRDFDIPPPGDIRNCLVAMSDADPLIGELFQYRFEASILKGHAFGNLFLAVLTKLSGDFRTAIERARSLLSVRGQVIPATDHKVVLVAEHPDGTKSTGEQAISHSGKTITRISLVPKPPPISDEIARKIAEADLVCLGPGSLYTSITPNLLVPGMPAAINKSKAAVVYVANLMTQPGETDRFDLESHMRALMSIDVGLRIDTVVSRAEELDEECLRRYSLESSDPIEKDISQDRVLGVPILRKKLVQSGEQIRHDPELLADAVLDAYTQIRSQGKVSCS